MSTFAESPDLIRQVRSSAEGITITPAFTTFLADVATGAVDSTELRARLNASGGYARDELGDDFRIGGRVVVERRVVTEDQKLVIAYDEFWRRSIIERNNAGRNFTSFASDIIKDQFDSTELRARLNASGGYARDELGDDFKNGGRLVFERREIRPQLSSVLEDLQQIRMETSTLNRRVGTTSSFYRELNADTYATDEFVARLNASDGYARDELGDDFRIGGRIVVERRVVDATDKALLLGDLRDIQEVNRALQTTATYASYLAETLSQRYSLDELRARLNASDGYARDELGDDFRIGGRIVVERRVVDVDQKQRLLETYQLLEDCGEYRDVLASELLSGNSGSSTLASIDSAIAASVTLGDANRVIAKREAAVLVARNWRRGRVDAEVASTIVSTQGDTEQVFRLIRDDVEEDMVDRRRAEALTALCYKRRRISFTANIVTALSDPEADIDSLLQDITSLGTSPAPLDRQRALFLTQYLYGTEITRDQSRLATALASPDGLEQYQSILGSIKLRPGVEGYPYIEAVQQRTERLKPLENAVTEIRIDGMVNVALQNFESATPASVLALINEIAEQPSGDEAAQATLEYYKLYLANRRESRREDYENVFSFEVEALRRNLANSYDFNEGLGSNLPAAKQLAQKFSDIILPLFQSLKGEPAFQDLMQSFMGDRSQGNTEPRDRFTLDIDRLAAQRNLTENEVTYLKSVTALSAFNPYLVAIANANPGLAFAYLESYFTELSAATQEQFFPQNGEPAYVPLIQIGTGPNGMASLGEIMRKRPDLIGNTLVLEDLDLPSGPFGVPKGEAWDLNSANASGFDALVMPDPATAELDGKRVRDFGAPTRFFPGERVGQLDESIEQSNVRPGSINTTVDYLPTPDGISNGRYPNNEDLSLILQLQAAMLAQNLSLKTKLIGVEKAAPGAPGQWLAWVQRTNARGETSIDSVYTDGVITSTGLGEKSYGFNLQGSRANSVLQTQPELGFPKLSTTLDAFKSLANKEANSPIPGQTIIIYGNGNSTDTLVEYFAGLFDSNNPRVRNVKKIYVVGNGQFSKRPRYAKISDVQKRNGRESLVEVVEARVSDVEYTDPANPDSSKLRIFDSNGNIVTDERGREVQGDHVIAATGFRPQLNSIFVGTGAVQQTDTGARLDTTQVTLPTNPNVSVAETITGYPELLLVGTASAANFEVTDKLLQLPDLAREALLRNGAENAVAIGFRAPDTQAAVRLYLENNDGLGRKLAAKKGRARNFIQAAEQSNTPAIIPIAATSTQYLPSLRNDIASGSETLSPLLLRKFAPVKLVGAAREKSYSMRLNVNGGVSLATTGDEPNGLIALLKGAVENPYFQAYAQDAVRLRRGSNGIDITLQFRNGRLSYKDSYAQAS